MIKGLLLMTSIIFYSDVLRYTVPLKNPTPFQYLLASLKFHEKTTFMVDTLFTGAELKRAQEYIKVLDSVKLFPSRDSGTKFRLSVHIIKTLGVVPALALNICQQLYFGAMNKSQREGTELSCKVYRKNFQVITLEWHTVQRALKQLEDYGYISRNKNVRRGIVLTHVDRFDKDFSNVRGSAKVDTPAVSKPEPNNSIPKDSTIMVIPKNDKVFPNTGDFAIDWSKLKPIVIQKEATVTKEEFQMLPAQIILNKVDTSTNSAQVKKEDTKDEFDTMDWTLINREELPGFAKLPRIQQRQIRRAFLSKTKSSIYKIDRGDYWVGDSCPNCTNEIPTTFFFCPCCGLKRHSLSDTVLEKAFALV